MSITYTFPVDFPVAAVRGLVAVDGQWTTVTVGGKRVDAVRFSTRIGSQQLIATVAGKPELEQMLADKRAAEAAHAASLEGQRETLAQAEYNSYSPDHFPGTAGWRANKRAADALAAFDEAHPEIAAAIEARRQATEKARYDALSDFVKMGS